MESERSSRTKRILTILIVVTVLSVLIGSARHLFGMFASGRIKEEEGSLEAFESIELDMQLGDVRILTGDDFSWSGKFPERVMPVFKVSGNQLKITQKSGRKVNLNIGENTCLLTITIPKGTSLRSVEADMDLGTFSADDLTCEKADFDLDLGSLTLSGCTVGSLEADVDLGSIELKNCSLDKAKLNTDLGSIKIDGQEYGKSYST